MPPKKGRPRKAAAGRRRFRSTDELGLLERFTVISQPECSVPVWQMRSNEDARLCGFFVGQVRAHWVGFICCAVAVVLAVAHIIEDGPHMWQAVLVIFISAVLVSVMMYWVLTRFGMWRTELLFREYTARSAALRRAGMSRSAVARAFVDMDNIKLQNEGRQAAARIQAAAISKRR